MKVRLVFLEISEKELFRMQGSCHFSQVYSSIALAPSGAILKEFGSGANPRPKGLLDKHLRNVASK